MFDRFTDGAKRVMNQARDEARSARHSTLSTGHMLLGATHEGSGTAARILAQIGLRAEDVRQSFVRITAEARDEEDTASSHLALPFSSPAKKALEAALERTQELRATEFGSEHLLLGLLDDEENDACRALREVGIQPGDVRTAALRHLTDARDGSGPEG